MEPNSTGAKETIEYFRFGASLDFSLSCREIKLQPSSTGFRHIGIRAVESLHGIEILGKMRSPDVEVPIKHWAIKLRACKA